MTGRDDIFDQCLKLMSCNSYDGLFDQLTSFADSLGANQYLYSAVPTCHELEAKAMPVCETNFESSWMEYYEDQNYALHDPMFLHCFSGNEAPMAFRQDIPPGPPTKTLLKIMAEANDAGVRSGITLPMHNWHGSVGILTLTYDGPARQFDDFYRSRIDAMALFGYAFNESVQRQFSKRFISPYVPSLSNKECEVLNWLARGFSYDLIADKQNVGVSTIRKQVSMVISKLGARNSTHACTLALRWGLIE